MKIIFIYSTLAVDHCNLEKNLFPSSLVLLRRHAALSCTITPLSRSGSLQARTRCIEGEKHTGGPLSLYSSLPSLTLSRSEISIARQLSSYPSLQRAGCSFEEMVVGSVEQQEMVNDAKFEKESESISDPKGGLKGFDSDKAKLKRKLYVGSQALGFRRDHMEVISPFKDGVVADWDIVDNIWAHAFRERLLIDPMEHPMLLAEPTSNAPQQRERESATQIDGVFHSSRILKDRFQLCKSSYSKKIVAFSNFQSLI